MIVQDTATSTCCVVKMKFWKNSRSTKLKLKTNWEKPLKWLEVIEEVSMMDPSMLSVRRKASYIRPLLPIHQNLTEFRKKESNSERDDECNVAGIWATAESVGKRCQPWSFVHKDTHQCKASSSRLGKQQEALCAI
ncbi:unnamed protein product [Microthlaspi erraticum]|uniref:Uncharacterized protein n=1 Tax=Microthlaspi erraticum TaxID=1685480 RepID=A0A6D2KSJ5_9BRAS|nr:unnamed protein product [Microthlaspi erraticum]